MADGSGDEADLSPHYDCQFFYGKYVHIFCFDVCHNSSNGYRYVYRVLVCIDGVFVILHCIPHSCEVAETDYMETTHRADPFTVVLWLGSSRFNLGTKGRGTIVEKC